MGITKESQVLCAALRLPVGKHSNMVPLPLTRTINVLYPDKGHLLEPHHRLRSMSRQARRWEYKVYMGRVRYKDHMHLLRVLRDQVAALCRWEGHNSLQCKAPRRVRVLAAHHKTCRKQHQRSPNRPNIVSAFFVDSYEMLLNEHFQCSSRRPLTYSRDICAGV